jgi:hypothetical protein
MGETDFHLNENAMNRLKKTIKGHNIGFWVSIAAVLTFLFAFAWVPYQLANNDRWLYVLLHVSVLIAAIVLAIPVFRLSKRFLIDATMIKLMNPEISRRNIKPNQIFDLILICWVMVFCLGAPLILAFVVFEVHQTIALAWGVLAVWATSATMEFQIVRTLEKMRSDLFGPEE